MKHYLSILVTVTFSLFLNAQDVGYVHTSTAENTVGDFDHRTLLDHPDLNGNPDAKVMVVQREGGNPHPVGLYYSSASSRWGVFNEDLAPMSVGTEFNVYIADDSEVTVHVADDFSSSHPSISLLDGYLSGDYLFHNTSFNPNSIYNPFVYGNYYDSSLSKRGIYEEGGNNIPEGAGFRVMKGSGSSASFASVISSPSNIYENWVMIDDPLINHNPDAVFLFSHYWGFNDNNGYLPSVTEAVYWADYWWISASTLSAFPENVMIDIIIPDIILGTDDVQQEFSKISLYPNPVVDLVNISSSKENIHAVEIYNVSGKLVQSFKETGKSVSLDVAALPTGMYIAKVKTDEGWFSRKLIKK